jgi:hypothetical protein
MTSSRIQFFVTGVALWVCLLTMLTATCGASSSIVIGGDYTDVGSIVIISPKPGDTPMANGTALLNNLEQITGDVNNPYLIKLGPGVYDIGTTSLQMKPYVDIEGSGEKTTKITGIVTNTTSPPTHGTVNGASNAELRFVTVENTGGGQHTVALLNSSASPSILHVTASASVGSGSNRYGVYNYSSSPVMTNVTASASGGASFQFGVYNDSSSPVMTNVTASASGATAINYGVANDSSFPVMTNVTASAWGTANNYGVYNDSSSPVMTNVTARAFQGTLNKYGVYNRSSGTVKINHSVISGTTNTIRNESGVTTRVGNTQLDGGAVNNAGTLTCVGAYDENYVALSTICE